MADTWIKMRCDLATDPAVIAIAAACELDADTVVGKLHRLWSWADAQLTDGNAPGVTKKWVDWYVRHDNFAGAMCAAGWLEARRGRIVFPKFDKHMSQSAKTRAVTAKRAAKCREKSNAQSVSKRAPRGEERRGDKNTPLREKGAPEKNDEKTASGQSIVRVKATDVEALAGRLFMKIGYTGDDGSFVWKIAAAVHAGRLSENDAHTAAENTSRKAQGNLVAYFRRAIEHRLEEKGGGLNAMLRGIKIMPRLPKSPPEASDFGDELAAKLKTKTK